MEQIETINAIAELERVGWAWETRGSNEITLKCPVHSPDKNPSVNLNVKSNRWKCHAAHCDARGDIITFLGLVLQVNRSTIIADLLTRYEDLHPVKQINAEVVEKHHEKIWASGPLYQALQDRGLDATLVKKARLGFNDGRITIPIFDKQRRIVNVRKYLPGAPGAEKFRDTKGYAKVRLYMPEQLEYETIWLCGGEMKALAATKYLNPKEIGAVSATGGEGSWNKELTPLFKDKLIFICMDIDAGGIAASQKLAAQLLKTSKNTSIIHLPLDPTIHPKGDLSDWIMTGVSFESFQELMENALVFQFKDLDSESEVLETKEVRLQEATSPKNLGKRLNCTGLICTMHHNPYLAPKVVAVTCSMDQPNCKICPVASKEKGENGEINMKVKGTSAGLLEVLDVPKFRQREAIREALNIPSCKVAEFETKESYALFDAQLTPQLDLHYGGNAEHVVQPAFIISDVALQLNMPYEFSGRLHPHPKTQQAVLLLDEITETPDNLETYQASEEELKSLQVFQPKEITIAGIQEKLDAIYLDLETNVTRIFKRRNLHFALDLAWHSVLYFNFDGRMQNGWINVLITGDSSQGKSEASLRLLEHYGLGTRFDCKRATTAGLLGGMQQYSNRWYTTWGVIPTHDRQLVILEEIKGMGVEVLGSLTDMRSSGIAQLVKIEKRRSHARTRLIMISNPRDDRPVSAHPFGITMLRDLIGAPEDIRRFDFGIILSATAIETSEINRLQHGCPKITPVYTDDLCKKLILFAWTRTLAQIKFDEDATEQCIASAIHLCATFTEVIPLVDQGTMRYKLARMAIALAIRTFSSDGDLVFVKKVHVEYITKFIEQQYTEASFGYDDFTMQQDFHASIPDEPIVRKELSGTKYPKDLINHLLVTEELVHSDLCDWCEIEYDIARSLMSTLTRKHCVVREKRAYRKTPAFIQLLKTMKKEGVPESGQASPSDLF